ncbi:hypothetical protein PAXRUDRAFT_172078 [Paxillus rubicundulus Ve08.2h10]|uniref:Uncharacterized protein n=1 Tax=Paxillus rubicundulus Ve08.2h10 TaxID=930991 RepID=A0A0D0D6C4_9AGAM|nr:hypothetical protein PAXRUDRAFT_172078 [Paxillus rubicundulus Ve08.2h10]
MIQIKVAVLCGSKHGSTNRKRKSQARTINAQWLTSAEELWECDIQSTAREVKAKKKAEVVAQKVSKQVDRIILQAAQGSNVHFSGALSTKGKEDLVDVANQLKIETTSGK